MNELTSVATKLNITVNEARLVIKKYNYKSADLTKDIADFIVRTELGETQEVFAGAKEPVKTASEEKVEKGVCYLELVTEESQAMVLFSLAQSFDLDPNNLPPGEIETLKAMLKEGEICQQANQFLEDSDRVLIASQFTDFKIKVESGIATSELAADIVFKASKSAYNRRLLELTEEDREDYQSEQEKIQSGLIHLLCQPEEMNTEEYQNKAIAGTNRFFGKAARRTQMLSRIK